MCLVHMLQLLITVGNFSQLSSLFYQCHTFTPLIYGIDRGILWGPLSGLLMAELIATGNASTVDITSFNIERFEKQGYGISRRGKKVNGIDIGEQW